MFGQDLFQPTTYVPMCRHLLLKNCVEYLARKLPLTNILLQNVACISPLVRQQPQSLQMFNAIVSQLPYCTNNIDALRAEWHKYQEEDIAEELYIVDKGQNEDGTGYVKFWSIDEYWHKIMLLTDCRGEPKYPGVAVIVKMILSLSHGQADVERGLASTKES